MKDSVIDAIGKIDNDMIEAADAVRQGKKKKSWLKWTAMAACFCIVICGVFAFANQKKDNGVQSWKPGFAAEQYFANSISQESSTSACIADSAIGWAQSRDFSDNRAAYEETGIIPTIDTHPLFSAQVNYNADGSLYDVVFSWYRRDDNYSDLTVTAGFEQVPMIEDCITVEVDEKGNPIESGVTVTERDGVTIAAVGSENQKKTITFQNEAGWYQITGSWNDSYEAVAQLLDWFWEHPIDFTQFPMEAGTVNSDSDLLGTPDAFSRYLPDFESLGYALETSYVRMKNGEPNTLEAYYASDVAEVHWCITAEPTVYDYEDSLGDLKDLTEEKILNLKPVDDVTTQTKVCFVQDECVVTVYASNLSEVWNLIASIQ